MSDELFACPHCGHEADKLVVGNIVTERRFAGAESVSFRYRFIPQEVAEKRALMGDAGNMIQDSGEVHFTKRSDERRFHKTFMEKVFAQ
jgi:hypothetical protein